MILDHRVCINFADDPKHKDIAPCRYGEQNAEKSYRQVPEGRTYEERHYSKEQCR